MTHEIEITLINNPIMNFALVVFVIGFIIAILKYLRRILPF